MKTFLMLFIPNPEKATNRGEGETRYRSRKHKFQVVYPKFCSNFALTLLTFCFPQLWQILGRREWRGRKKKRKKEIKKCLVSIGQNQLYVLDHLSILNFCIVKQVRELVVGSLGKCKWKKHLVKNTMVMKDTKLGNLRILTKKSLCD